MRDAAGPIDEPAYIDAFGTLSMTARRRSMAVLVGLRCVPSTCATIYPALSGSRALIGEFAPSSSWTSFLEFDTRLASRDITQRTKSAFRTVL